jgi:hypothetical protein
MNTKKNTNPHIKQGTPCLPGKPVPVSVAVADASAVPASPAREQSGEPRRDRPADKSPAEDVKAEALANSTVQAVLEIFPVDKTIIEEH